jgi:hypothetical protein
MIRLYRVKWENRHGKTFTNRDGVPADVADAVFADFERGLYEGFDWYRVWIETLDGKLVDVCQRERLV